MNDLLTLLLAGLFLPLFPLSMGFNFLLSRAGHVALRVLLFLWPLAGLLLLQNLEIVIPDWIPPLALFTSALYAFRALALRDIGEWSGFLATSSWALLWIPLQQGTPHLTVAFYALAFSLPLVLLLFLGAGLERRFGAACTGLYGGLAASMPRFSALLVLVVLAIIATPLFPAFFIMIATIVQAMSAMPVIAAGVVGIWLLWSWAGAWLLQGLVAGEPGETRIADLRAGATLGYALAIVLMVAVGLYGMGELL